MKLLNGKLKCGYLVIVISAFAIFLGSTNEIAEMQSLEYFRIQAAAPGELLESTQVHSWTNFQTSSVVLGQPDFSSSTAGTTATKFNHSSQAAVDPVTGKVFVADFSNNRVLRFTSAAALVSGSAAEAVFGQANMTSSTAATTQSGMRSPIGLTIDSTGRLWVGDRSNNRVLRFDNAATKASGANADGVLGQANFTISTAATSQSGMNLPFGVAADSAGHLWVAEYNNNRVLRFDGAASKTNGANADAVLGQPDFTTGIFKTTQSGMGEPVGVNLDAGGRLWVAEYGNNRVLKFDDAAAKANGANADVVLGEADFTSAGGGTTATRMFIPYGVATDSSGRLYVVDSGNHRVLIYNSAAALTSGANASNVLGQPNFTTAVANNGGIGASTLSGPLYNFFDEASQTLLVGDYGNNRVLRFSPAGPTAASISAGGRVQTARGQGITGVVIKVTDSEGSSMTVTSSAFGYFHFTDLKAGETYVIGASAKRYTFGQPVQVFNAAADLDNLDFIAN